MTAKEKPMSKAQKRIEELRDIYAKTTETKKAKIMLYGEWGSYKSTIAATMPRPILIHSFDPGGDKIKHLQDGVNDGSIIIDNSWQSRTMSNSGDRFGAWNSAYNNLKRIGVFNEIGTFVIDSLTTFQRLVVDAAVEANTKNSYVSKNMPVKVPQMRDYGVQDSAMEFAISDILDLPCHVLVIAHSEVHEDTDNKGNVVGREHRPLITGKKLRAKLPMLFDEIYISRVQGNRSEVLTRPSGMYHSRTRIGSLFNMPGSFQNKEPGEFHLTRDILVPAGYADKSEIVKI